MSDGQSKPALSSDHDVVQIAPRSAWPSRLLTLVPAGVAAVAVVWPQAFGWSATSPFALLVALRGLVAVVLAALAVVFLLVGLAWARRTLWTLWTLSIVALAAALTSVLIMVTRGLTSDAVPPATENDAVVRVLAFNTLGSVSSDQLAEMVKDVDADVIVLSETSRETTERLASLLGGGFQVFHRQPGPAINAATGLLVDSRLGAHGSPVQAPSNPHGLFTVPPSVSPPVTPYGFPVTAVHATRPHLTRGTHAWATNVRWAVDQCRESFGAIVAGDFNATLDHEPMRDLGHCVDAADVRGAGGIGTWPANFPAWMGTPIDHILVDARAWSVSSFTVLDDTPSVAIIDRWLPRCGRSLDSHRAHLGDQPVE